MRFRPLLLLVVQFIFVVFSASGAISASEAGEPSKEEKLKAAYLLNFTKFITWPKTHIAEKTSIRICLQDRTPFEEFFKSLAVDSNLNGNKNKVEVHQLSSATQCDLTYLHYPNQKIDSNISYGLVVLASKDILETEAAITFYISNRKLRFEINVDRVAEEGTVISSELLKLARIK